MKYYFSPLEGITNYIYRNLHSKYFEGVDKYYIPFISPIEGKLKEKDKYEVLPENNNLSCKVVPQIISKNVKDTIEVIHYLESLGYDEINLNFGCPSPTVVTKQKGSGMLKDLDYLDHYLKEIFSNTKVHISVKTRLGLENKNEFIKILEIYNKYPIYELIVHPRVTNDYYSKPIHMDMFEYALNNTHIDIIYNGDIDSLKKAKEIESKYPSVKAIMVGRKLVAYPDMFSKEKDKEKVKDFFFELKEKYKEKYGWNNTLFYIKEILALLIDYFEVDDKTKKLIFKSKKESEFDNLIKAL